jgi:hypothetical protein
MESDAVTSCEESVRNDGENWGMLDDILQRSLWQRLLDSSPYKKLLLQTYVDRDRLLVQNPDINY